MSWLDFPVATNNPTSQRCEFPAYITAELQVTHGSPGLALTWPHSGAAKEQPPSGAWAFRGG